MGEPEKFQLFVGGISRETNHKKLRDHFSRYGTVLRVDMPFDRAIKGSFGYGFVTFSNSAAYNEALNDRHTIDQKEVRVAKAVPKREIFGNQNQGEDSSQVRKTKCRQRKYRNKKIFFRGISPSVSENELQQYFEQFGSVFYVALNYSRKTKQSRGSGFITFESEVAVDKVLQERFHEIRAGSKQAEVERAGRESPTNSRVGESSGSLSNPDPGHNHQLGQNPIPNTYASGPSHHQQGDYGAPNAYVSGPSHHQPAGYYRTPNPYASNLGLHQPAVYYGTPNPYASNLGLHQLAHYPASNPYVSGPGHHRPEHYGPSNLFVSGPSHHQPENYGVPNPYVSGPSDHQPEHIGAPNPYVSSPSNHQPAYYSTPDYLYEPYPYYAPPRPYGYEFHHGGGYYGPSSLDNSGVPNMEVYSYPSEFTNDGGQEDDTNVTSVQTAGLEGDGEPEIE